MIKAVLSAFYRWREKIMKKRILGAMLIIMALLMMPSCSLEGTLRAFGSNITGPSEESKAAIESTLAFIETDFNENWDSTEAFSNFAQKFSSINGNPAAINQLVKELKEKLPEDSAAIKESKEFITGVVDMISDMSGSDFDLNTVEIPDTGNAVLNDAIDKALKGFRTLNDPDYIPSYGDALLLKVTDFALDMAQDISSSGKQPDMNEILDLVSGAIPVITSVLPSTVLKDIDLGAVLNEAVKMATSSNTSEEGGEAV